MRGSQKVIIDSIEIERSAGEVLYLNCNNSNTVNKINIS